jgi:hypothetical protein
MAKVWEKISMSKSNITKSRIKIFILQFMVGPMYRFLIVIKSFLFSLIKQVLLDRAKISPDKSKEI